MKQRADNLVKKRLTEVLKAPKPSPAKTDPCNPFHNRTQTEQKCAKTLQFYT